MITRFNATKQQLFYLIMALLLAISLLPIPAHAEQADLRQESGSAVNELAGSQLYGLATKVQDSLELSRLYYLSNSPSYIDDNGSYSDFWTFLAMTAAGIDLKVPQIWTEGSPYDEHTYWQTGKKVLRDGREYAGSIIGSYLLGQDPQWFGRDDLQQNLIEGVISQQKDDGSLFADYLQHLWAVLALDVAGVDYNRSAAIEYILNQQTASGTFPWGMDGTGWTLAALAPYQDQPEVRIAVEKTIQYFHGRFNDNGEIDGQMAGRNANSLATAIFGLNAAGENLLSEKWTRNGNNIIEVFIDRYQAADGAYKWLESDTESNSIATYQAVIAISDVVAGKSIYQRLSGLAETSALIQVTLRVEGSSNTIYDGYVRMNPADFESDITVYDLLQQVFSEHNIAVEYGDYEGSYYIVEIDGESQAQFQAYDGWLYLVNGVSPWDGINKYVLNNGDDVYIYYGNSGELYEGSGVAEQVDQLTLMPRIEVTPARPIAGKPIQIAVTSNYDVYTETWDVTNKTTRIEGALIELNGKSYYTDERGMVTIPASEAKAGTFTIKVSKDVKNSYPRLIRQKAEITIAESVDQLIPYEDANEVSEWARENVYKAYQFGLLQGFAGGKFAPQTPLSRAELAMLLSNLPGNQAAASTETIFFDVTEQDSYYEAVQKVAASGWMEGTGEHTFSPQLPVTREQLAVVLGRMLQLKEEVSGETESKISDLEDASSWARTWIVRVYAAQILVGDGNQFNPQQAVTREMAAVMAVRIFEQVKQ